MQGSLINTGCPYAGSDLNLWIVIGEGDQAKSNLKDAGEKVKDAFKK
jgi:hypothetical protein